MEFLANLHPKFVHFSIALFSTYILLEIIYLIFPKDWLNKTVQIILLLGIIFTVGTVLTGNQAEQNVEDVLENKLPHVKEILEEHEDYGTLVLWFFAAIGVFRTLLFIKKKINRKMQIVLVFLALFGSYLVLETGEYGGKLVYDHGVGTELFKEKYINE